MYLFSFWKKLKFSEIQLNYIQDNIFTGGLDSPCPGGPGGPSAETFSDSILSEAVDHSTRLSQLQSSPCGLW